MAPRVGRATLAFSSLTSKMPPPPGPNAPSTVQVSQYAHLAPTEVRNSFNRDEIRQLVLEYLISGCYVDSAQAFASEVDMLDQSVDEGIHRTKDASSSRVGAANGHESVSEMTNGRHRGNGTEVPTSSGLYPDVHAMEGVEGTPEPEITPRRQDNPSAPMNELEGDDAQSVKGGATFNGAGKKVMFESIRDDSLEEDRETSLLSLRRLKKARQRRRKLLLATRPSDLQTHVESNLCRYSRRYSERANSERYRFDPKALSSFTRRSSSPGHADTNARSAKIESSARAKVPAR